MLLLVLLTTVNINKYDNLNRQNLAKTSMGQEQEGVILGHVKVLKETDGIDDGEWGIYCTLCFGICLFLTTFEMWLTYK